MISVKCYYAAVHHAEHRKGSILTRLPTPGHGSCRSGRRFVIDGPIKLGSRPPRWYRDLLTSGLESHRHDAFKAEKSTLGISVCTSLVQALRQGCSVGNVNTGCIGSLVPQSDLDCATSGPSNPFSCTCGYVHGRLARSR
jgi:hypothetical protein